MWGKLKHIGKEKNLSSLMANVSVAFMGLVSFMLLTRQLDKELFGEWVLFITLATFVDLLRFGLTRTSSVRQLSGADSTLQKSILGASFRINLILLLILTFLCWLIFGLLEFYGIQINNGYRLFLFYYPFLALSNLSWNNAMSLFQAEQNFRRMMVVRISNVGLFCVFLLLNQWWLKLGIIEIIWMNVAVNAVSSIWCTVKSWDGLFYLKYAQRKMEKELVNFGKYSMGTLISSSLLKSSDTFIIGMSPFLGSAGIAMYAIPLKLTDLLGIPLHSFAMTAYPRMSKKALEGDLLGTKKIFYSYVGIITLLFFPVALGSFVFAEYLVLFLGGNEYLDSLPLLTLIFRVFTVYIMLLPLDRFTGVLLDSINRPKLNLYKVLVMTFANIILNLLAVFVFKSLVAVAIGTVMFTLMGIFLGFHYLKKEIQVKGRHIVSESMHFIKNLKTHLG
ncbi:oligosaccharide flippase family protein [Flagellimonas flava]|uniref:Membrane protein involved in the export of O-antigen and teichoic acid n=1 Tax=Flagellimonas flava TaxID=570519 RepID=A0A1M5LWW7_9FLAO|nr:oligosaccharide flippase family protein [Allomuricauda flava]SHG69537.1 Membrane protein involved in the export of O-antigen and teichoic acid [Allomuricauda flava]